MQPPIVSSPAQARQTRERFAKPEDQLSYELGKAVQELPPLYTRLLAGGISLLVFGTIAWAQFSKVVKIELLKLKPRSPRLNPTLQTLEIKLLKLETK